jgi:hypothetical protein
MVKHLRNIIFGFITSCSLNIAAQPQYTIERASFNTNQYDEYSPAFYKKGIVFCSNRKNDIVVSYTDTSDVPKSLSDYYYTDQKENKKWHVPGVFDKELNTHFQEGPLCFYNDSNSMVFTRNLYVDKEFGNYLKSGNNVGLFFATYSNGKWTNITPFKYNNSEYNIMHPAITNDGKTLYFVSDKPEGIGGFDIYVSYFKAGDWTAPKNLGDQVNSTKNEAFPFVHNSGRLYFASQGWNSKGGYDIFFTQDFDGKWIRPQNMKEPFNSTADDFGFIADTYLQKGFFTSNRSKTDDIYIFNSIITDFENCKQIQKNNFCYVFFENGTSEGDVTGSMKYEWDLGDGTKIRAIEAEHCFAKTGEYLIKLNVIDSITGDVYFSQAEYKLLVEEVEQPIITAPDNIVEGQPVEFDAKKTNLKNFKVAKYYWDFGDGLKSIGENVTHVFYQEGVYDVKLNVESIPGRAGVRRVCVYKPIIVKKQ